MLDLQQFLLHAGVGSIAGVCGVYVGAPLDTVKVLLQGQKANAQGQEASDEWKRQKTKGK